jgi:hypothetical protein
MSHLFVIDQKTISSITQETVRKTAADLKELGLYKLPYTACTEQMPTTARPPT